MNDELSGQLTANWIIPDYAQETLVLETDSGVYPTVGPYGLFEMEAPARTLTLRWCGEKGPALAHLQWQADSLEWDGRVRIGGYVDAVHVTYDAQSPIAVIYLGGQPLKVSANGYPVANKRKNVPYPSPNFYDGIAAEVPESVTTWLAPDNGMLASIARDALMNNLRLHFYGTLADDSSGWDAYFALPIMLQSVTLFGP